MCFNHMVLITVLNFIKNALYLSPTITTPFLHRHGKKYCFMTHHFHLGFSSWLQFEAANRRSLNVYLENEIEVFFKLTSKPLNKTVEHFSLLYSSFCSSSSAAADSCCTLLGKCYTRSNESTLCSMKRLLNYWVKDLSCALLAIAFTLI